MRFASVALLALLTLSMPSALQRSAPSPDLRLWYTHAAANWNEALPIGNGRLGAMVFGGIEQEHLQLNEDTIWAGEKRDRVNPAGSEAVKEVRRLRRRRFARLCRRMRRPGRSRRRVRNHFVRCARRMSRTISGCSTGLRSIFLRRRIFRLKAKATR
jgi:hypothetical protein